MMLVFLMATSLNGRAGTKSWLVSTGLLECVSFQDCRLSLAVVDVPTDGFQKLRHLAMIWEDTSMRTVSGILSSRRALNV